MWGCINFPLLQSKPHSHFESIGLYNLKVGFAKAQIEISLAFDWLLWLWLFYETYSKENLKTKSIVFLEQPQSRFFLTLSLFRQFWSLTWQTDSNLLNTWMYTFSFAVSGHCRHQAPTLFKRAFEGSPDEADSWESRMSPVSIPTAGAVHTKSK